MRNSTIIRLVILLIFTFGTASVEAQLTINSIVPANGITMKPQLWNFSIVNGYPYPVDCRITLVIKSLSSQEIIMSGVCTKFIIGQGSKVIQYQNVQPIQYTYNGHTVSDLSPDGILPVGEYEVCYQLYVLYNDSQELAAEDCIRVDIDPLSPLLLNVPADRDTIADLHPVFSWIMPGPPSMISNPASEIFLVEVKNGQSSAEAIQKNLPLFRQKNYQQSSILYPSEARNLLGGKTYAWQVVASSAAGLVSKSEVWTFFVASDSNVKKVIDEPFIRIGEKPTTIVVATDGVVRLNYHHELGDSTVRLELLNVGNKTRVMHSTNISVSRGQNYLVYDFEKKIRLSEKEIYEARLTNSLGRTYLLRFYTVTTKN